jgi:hypothetical protein
MSWLMSTGKSKCTPGKLLGNITEGMIMLMRIKRFLLLLIRSGFLPRDQLTAHKRVCRITGSTRDDDTELDAPILNPLFHYTFVAGDKFVLDHNMTPLAIYHLWDSLAYQDESEVGFPTNFPDNIKDKANFHLKKTIISAKAQFIGVKHSGSL